MKQHAGAEGHGILLRWVEARVGTAKNLTVEENTIPSTRKVKGIG
jgi:hypothetical protein